MIVRDLNGDGRLDTIVGSGPNVVVLLGRGDGTFEPPRFFPAGVSPSSMVAADVNGDGKVDLILGGSNQVRMSVLLGHGDGSFDPPLSFAGRSPETMTGGEPATVDLAVGDLNGDGKPDLAITTYSGTRIYVCNGDGTFQFAGSYGAPQPLRNVVLADLDGDGKLDMIVGGGGVNVFKGNGDATFQTNVNYPGSGYVNVLAAVDLNGDGKVDVVVGSQQFSGVSVFLNLGNGTLGGATTYDAEWVPSAILPKDVDGDGKPDVVVAGEYGFSILLGNGDGTLQPARSCIAGTRPRGVAAGDFDGDGRQDLAVTSASGTSIVLGEGGAARSARRGAIRRTRAMSRPAISTATAAPTSSWPARGSLPSWGIQTERFDGRPRFKPARPSTRSPSRISAATGGWTVLSTDTRLGNGDGSFQSTPLVTNGANGVAVGDFNGDGRADMALGLNASIGVRLGNGNGTFGPLQPYPTDSGASLATADLNGDGRTDIVDGGYGGPRVFIAKPDGTFFPGVRYTAGSNSASVTLSDVNGDGKLDIPTAHGYPPAVYVLLGNGDGTFQAARSCPGGPQPVSVAAGDFDGDGKKDLVANGGSVGNIALLRGHGDGTFDPPVFLDAAYLSEVLVRDFDGDGRADVAAGSGIGLIVFFSTGDSGVFAAAQTALASSANPSPFGRQLTLTATVTSPAGIPAGYVTFYYGSIALGTVALASGSAQLATSALAAGPHTLMAVFDSSAGFGSSASPPLDQVIDRATTTTTLTSSPNPVPPGSFVTFTVTVSSSAPGTPTGTVTISEETTVLAQRTLVNRQAFYTTNTLSPGPHVIVASYGGDTTFAPSTSVPLTEVVGRCPVGPQTLCLGTARFAVSVTWKNPYDGVSAGTGMAVSMTPDTGYFWFFDPRNVEVIVKVLDGRAVNGKFWVLYGSLTDVEFHMTVTDSETSIAKTYDNPPRVLASRIDTQAF